MTTTTSVHCIYCGGPVPGGCTCATVTEITPGTPEWDASEVALEAQRAAEYAPPAARPMYDRTDEANCPECGRNIDAYGGNPDCFVCAAEPATTTAGELRDAILAGDPTTVVHVEQTGGGCATIYVGEYNAEGRAWLALGPGSYDYGRPWASTFLLGEEATCIGPDDDGEADVVYVNTLAEITAAVAAYAAARA